MTNLDAHYSFQLAFLGCLAWLAAAEAQGLGSVDADLVAKSARQVPSIYLTAAEEPGCVGAVYLQEHQPQIFDSLDFALTFDGPIDFRSDYPAVSFITVVSKEDAQKAPYRRLIELVAGVAGKKHTRFGQTEMGLGMGDFAKFPAAAHSGLHIRSPQRGFHTKERVRLVDLINHVDLLCHILLQWDRDKSAQ